MKYVFASTIAAIAMVVLVSAQAAQDAPKYKISDVMKKGFNGKGSLVSKVTGGTATDAEKATFLDLVSALPHNTPKKGDAESWKKKTDALVMAAKDNDIASLKKATNCKACHDEFRPAKK